MKTRDLSLATFVLGALGVSIAACSAKAEGSLPTYSGGSGQGNAGSAGNVNAPAAGSAGMPIPGGAGAPSTFGGAPGSSGGAPASAGAGGAPVQGGAGAPATGCKAAVGSSAALAVDDLEDGENAIQMLGQRTGYWFTYNDGSAAQIPAPDPSGATPFKPSAGGHSAMFSAHTSGPAFTKWGAGMGFDFNNSASKSCAYDASAYAGIKFWAKGNVAIKAMVTVPGTTLMTGTNYGTCVGAAVCEDHYSLQPKPVLTDTWTQYTLDFASTTAFAQEGWGTQATFDKSHLLAVQFQVAMGLPFDFSIDDVTFY